MISRAKPKMTKALAIRSSRWIPIWLSFIGRDSTFSDDHLRCVVHRIVATARNAGQLVRSKRSHHRRVDGVFLKVPCASVAVQALGVLESARVSVIGFGGVLTYCM